MAKFSHPTIWIFFLHIMSRIWCHLETSLCYFSLTLTHNWHFKPFFISCNISNICPPLDLLWNKTEERRNVEWLVNVIVYHDRFLKGEYSEWNISELRKDHQINKSLHNRSTYQTSKDLIFVSMPTIVIKIIVLIIFGTIP